MRSELPRLYDELPRLYESEASLGKWPNADLLHGMYMTNGMMENVAQILKVNL